MEHHLTEQIKEFMRGLECPKGFKCSRCGFKDISTTKQFANEYFTCVDHSPRTCPHSLHFGYIYFCFCPLFTHVATVLLKEQRINDSNSFFEKTIVTSGCV